MKVQRNIVQKLAEEIDKPFISILIGPRQVGKSFLMRELAAICDAKKLKTHFYDLEDPNDLNEFAQDEDGISKMIVNSGDVVFIDEFHYIKNATKLFKYIYDTKKRVKIFASGSSSIEIHKHLKESLAGRFRATQIFPMSYYGEMSQDREYSIGDYMRTGGMPGIMHESGFDRKMMLLKNIVQTYLMKDIKGLIKEENIKAYNNLLYHLSHGQGSVVSASSLSREIGMSLPTVIKYLEILSKTFVCFQVESYSGNLANELKKSKKYYLYDIGIRNCILKDYSDIEQRADKGSIIETFVLLSLVRQIKENEEVKFWRTKTGDEVDFVLLKNRIPYPIEVKYKLDDKKIPAGLRKFLDSYPKSPSGLVITMNMTADIDYNGRLVRFRTLESIDKDLAGINRI